MRQGKRIDSIIGLGGGSSLDCAKGINFLLTQGGAIHDFQGYGKATKPMLPMIGVPTTAGTGSEAQSYAIISDPRTHQKMACGDPEGRVSRRHPRSASHADAARVGDRGGRLRRHRARRRELRVHEAQRAIAGAVARGVAAARGELRARACGARRSRRARRDAARCVLRGHGDRALDAGRHARVRESRDRALRHDARPRHRDSAAARRPLERQRSRRRCTPSCSAARRTCTHGTRCTRRTSLSPRGSLRSRVPAICRRRFATPALRATIWLRLPDEAAEQWTGRFNPRPFDATGAPGDLPMRVLIAAAARSVQPRLAAQQPSWPQFRGEPAADRRRVVDAGTDTEGDVDVRRRRGDRVVGGDCRRRGVSSGRRQES